MHNAACCVRFAPEIQRLSRRNTVAWLRRDKSQCSNPTTCCVIAKSGCCSGDTLARMDSGRAVLELARASGEPGLFAPSELTLLGKRLLQLHEIGRLLDSDFDPNAAIRRHVSEILRQHLRKDVTAGNLFGSMLEMKNFVGQLPTRVNKTLDTAGKGQIELKLRNDDTMRVLDGIHKVANRIASGLILAALIAGAALPMRVPTNFRILGYPGLAMLCFIGAAAGGVWLLLNIWLHDPKHPKFPR